MFKKRKRRRASRYSIHVRYDHYDAATDMPGKHFRAVTVPDRDCMFIIWDNEMDAPARMKNAQMHSRQVAEIRMAELEVAAQ